MLYDIQGKNSDLLYAPLLLHLQHNFYGVI